MGIEPTSEAWEASILPLYDARSFFSFSIIHNCALASTDRARSFSQFQLHTGTVPSYSNRKPSGSSRHRQGVHLSRASAIRAILPRIAVRAGQQGGPRGQVDLVPEPLAQVRY
jgi:hypothetical protein